MGRMTQPSIYIGTYPYEKMTEYNVYLLYEHS